jgi:WD40 repeat protein
VAGWQTAIAARTKPGNSIQKRDNLMRLQPSQTVLFLLAILGELWLSGHAGQALAADVRRPELLLPLGHTRPVNSVAMSRDGRRVLTGSGDQTAILWDTQTARPIRTFKGHTHGVTSVALSGDGKRVLTGSMDNSAILWEVETAKPLRTFKGHAGAVTSVALSGDGKRVLTGSMDNSAILWEVETARPLQTFKGPTLQDFQVVVPAPPQSRLRPSGIDRFSGVALG